MQVELVTIKEYLPSGEKLQGYAFSILDIDVSNCGWQYLFHMHRAAIICNKIPINLNPLYNKESIETTYIPVEECMRFGPAQFMQGSSLAIMLFICRVLPVNTYYRLVNEMESDEDSRVFVADAIHFITSTVIAEIGNPILFARAIDESCTAGNTIVVGIQDFQVYKDRARYGGSVSSISEIFGELPQTIVGVTSERMEKLERTTKFDRKIIVDQHMNVFRDSDFMGGKFIFPNASWCLSR